jgi:hypothetical protein
MQSDTQTHSGRSQGAVIRVYDDAGNVIETHEHKASSESRESACQLAVFSGKLPSMGEEIDDKLPSNSS